LAVVSIGHPPDQIRGGQLGRYHNRPAGWSQYLPVAVKSGTDRRLPGVLGAVGNLGSQRRAAITSNRIVVRNLSAEARNVSASDGLRQNA
jgi:hypothetical protein